MYSNAISGAYIYKIGNKSLPSASTQKDLGILVTKNPSWTPHLLIKFARVPILLSIILKEHSHHHPSLNDHTSDYKIDGLI